jgi:hypothetical protein
MAQPITTVINTSISIPEGRLLTDYTILINDSNALPTAMVVVTLSGKPSGKTFVTSFETTIPVAALTSISQSSSGISSPTDVAPITAPAASATEPTASVTALPTLNGISTSNGTSITAGITTTTGAPTSKATSVNQGNTGVSGGAVAGVAIGCLIAGAVIALIAGFFLYRRQSRRHPAAYHQSHLPYDSETKSGAAVTSTAVPAAGRNTDSLLPQPVEDAAITKELSKIRDNIKNHVQTYYQFQPVSGGIVNSELAALATATGLDTTVITAMLVTPSMRGDIMRLFIAWSVLSRCEEGRQPTLLPLELVAMLEALSKNKGRDNGEYISVPTPMS